MSISDNYAPDISTGNGSTTVFTGTWSPIAASYMRVYLELISTGVRTLVDQGAAADEYTLTFTSSGYSITMGTAPSSLYNLIRSREVGIDQSAPYTTARGWQGATIENSFDKLTAIAQDQQDAIDRSITFELGSSSSVTMPEPEAGKILGWNSAGDDLENITIEGITGFTPSRALVSDASGIVSTATTTSTEIGYVNGVTSAIQTQLNAKTSSTVVPSTAPSAGQILVGNAGGTAYAPVSASGDFTLASTGAATLANGFINSLTTVTLASGDSLAIADASDSGNKKKALVSDIGAAIAVSGTWTPTDASGAGLTLTVNSAVYVRIGALVFVQAYITYPSTANGSQAKIGGLPIAVAADKYGTAEIGTDATIAAFMSFRAGSSEVWPLLNSASGNVTNANLSTKYVTFSGFYIV